MISNASTQVDHTTTQVEHARMGEPALADHRNQSIEADNNQHAESQPAAVAQPATFVTPPPLRFQASEMEIHHHGATASSPTAAAASTTGPSGGAPHPGALTALSRQQSSKKSVAQLAREDMQQGQQGFLNLQMLQRSLWSDLPDLIITYKNLSYTYNVSSNDLEVPTLASSLIDTLLLRSFTNKRVAFPALQPNTGFLRPKEMTLILAPPGHGKSTLLQALAGRYHSDSRMAGEVLYNNMTYQEALDKGFHIKKMTAFVNQGDTHNALLTVKETLQFALDNAVANPALLDSAEYLEASAHKVDYMIDLLGLREASNTILGNAMLRGVSGGQRRRVSIGEMMITDARALFLDEITTGLDSSASYDILHALKSWCYLMNGSVMAALLQPTPECFELFDRLVLMRHGAIVYDGPISDVRAYFIDLGIPVPDDMDLGDYLSDFLTDPVSVYDRTIFRAARRANRIQGSPSQTLPAKGIDLQDEEKQHVVSINPATATATDESAAIGMSGASLSSEMAQNALKLAASKDAPLTTSSLKEAYVNSIFYKNNLAFMSKCAAISTMSSAAQFSAYSRAQFGGTNSRSWMQHLQFNIQRSTKNMLRNPSFFMPRIVQSNFIGLIFGGLFWQIPPENYQARLGLIIFTMTNIAFSNAAEIPFASESKAVAFKHLDAGFFPSATMVTSVILLQFPLSIVETIFLTLWIYFMSGFAVEAGRYFFFLLIIWQINIIASCIFRAVTYGTQHEEIANQVSAPIVATLFLSAGFLLLYNNFPRWMLGLYEFSPFTWGLRALAINEFNAERYNYISDLPAFPGMLEGEAEMRSWDIDPTFAYKWAAVGYLFGLFFFFAILSWFILDRVRYPLTVGTRRFADDDSDALVPPPGASNKIASEDHAVAGNARMERAMAAAQKYASSFKIKSSANSMPFVPIDLSWKNICYTIETKTDDGKPVRRKLLSDIDGFALSGQLTALMGSSGAGKTTLMDCIAGRKTSGLLEGQILVNGYPKVTNTFNRLVGYCEQTDCHTATQTVREALHFSARLRLPREVSEKQLTEFVQEILDILELTPIADRIVGDALTPGLSPGQLKRVTIGVELASNPSVLFLDEPTSGLDSRAALVVMRVVKRIAMTGRAVLCTIHQPSAELFYMFDRLLLLKSGGQTVYFGPVGVEGSTIVDYFENAVMPADGINYTKPKKAVTTNVASWMLSVIGAGTGTMSNDGGEVPDYLEIYRQSKMRATNLQMLEPLLKPKPGVPELKFDSVYAANYFYQVYELTLRSFQAFWRSPFAVYVRFGLMLFLGALLGFLYLQLSEGDIPSLISKLSAVFVGTVFVAWTLMSMTIPQVLRWRAVYYREQASFMYAPSAWAWSLTILEIPYSFLSSIIHLCLFYPMVGYQNNATAFFKFLLPHWLLLYSWISVGSFVAAALPNVMVANIVASILGTFMLLFSGIFRLPSQMPPGWKWLYYMSPIPKAVIAMCVAVFDCGDHCATFTDAKGPDGSDLPANITSYEYVLNYLDAGAWYGQWIGWLILTIFVIRLFFFWAVIRVNYMKR